MKKQATKILSAFLALLMVVLVLPAGVITVNAETYSGTCGDNLTYTFDTDTGTLTISGTGPLDGISLEPDYADLLTTVIIEDGVTSIGEWAFSSCYNLSNITIPNSVKSIGAYAFQLCSLWNVTIPSSVTYIDETAFMDSGAVNIIVDENNPNYASIDGNLYNKDCTVLMQYGTGKSETSFTLPDTVKKINRGAFYDFRFANSLSNIVISQNVEHIDGGTFDGCTNLESFTVDPQNPHYMAIDGVLYSKDESTLVAYPAAKWQGFFVIPNNVKVIGNSAFSASHPMYMNWFEYVVIPNSVTTIGKSAFYAFRGEKIIYCGNETEWNAIEKVKDWDQDADYKLQFHSYINGICEYCGAKDPDAVQILASGECGDNVNWTLYETGEMVISGTGKMKDYPAGKTPWYSDRNSINRVTILDGVTTVGAYAFYGCRSITEVSVGATVTTVGAHSFEYCSALKSVIIPDSVISIGDNAFQWCDLLEYVTIGNGVESIGNSAFKRSYNLKSVTFGNSLLSIGESAFHNCRSIVRIALPDTLTSIGKNAFYGCSDLVEVTLGSNVTDIGEDAFIYCFKLVEVYNRSDLAVTVGKNTNGYVGYYAKNMYTPIEGQSHLIRQGDYIFYKDNAAYYLVGCIGEETALILPDSIDGSAYYLYDYAFLNCDKMESVVIPNGVIGMGDKAFNGCEYLTKMVYCGTEEEWDAITKGYAWDKNAGIKTADGTYTLQFHSYINGICEYCGAKDPDAIIIVASGTCGDNLTWTLYSTGEMVISGTGEMVTVASSSDIPWANYRELIEKVIIEQGVTSIGFCAFWKCSNLNSITIPTSVTSIGKGAFYACTNLIQTENGVSYVDKWVVGYDKTIKSVTTLREDTVGIINYAFSMCDTLTSITIPSSVKNIGNRAFYDCSVLTTIMVDASNPNYCSIDGNLYNKDTTTLIQYAIGKKSTSFTVPSHVTHVHSSAFIRCTNIKNVVISNNVMDISAAAFFNCSNLVNITVDESNPNYCSIDGNLYSNDATILICYAPGKADASFTIPKNVISIDSYAFTYCDNIININILNNVTEIGVCAFDSCHNLEKIIYCGTEEEWDAITKGPGWDKNAGINTANGTYTLQFHSYVDAICEYCGTKDPDAIIIVASGTCGDNLTWTLYSTGEMVISGTGEMTNYTNSDTPWIKYRTFIKKVTIEEGVTSIGVYAFQAVTRLRYITLPTTLENIGAGAFNACYRLVEIVNLSDLDIRVGDDANGRIAYLARAVYTVAGKTNVSVDANGFVVYRNGKDAILVDYEGTEMITKLPDDITELGYGALHGCNFLKDLSLHEGVTKIGTLAFYQTTLETIKLPQSLKIIAGSAFRRSALTSITIPKGTTYIGMLAGEDDLGVFSGCNALTSITVEAENPVYHSIGNCLIETKTKTLIAGCQNSVIPTDGSVTIIGKYAFREINSLKTIAIPATVNTIDLQAFCSCENLERIIFCGTEAQWKAIAKGSRWDDKAGSKTQNGKYEVQYHSYVGGICEYCGELDPEAKPRIEGDTVVLLGKDGTYSVILANVDLAKNLGIELIFDSEFFEYVDCEFPFDALIQNFDETYLRAAFAWTEYTDINTTVFTFKLKALKAGETAVTCKILLENGTKIMEVIPLTVVVEKCPHDTKVVDTYDENGHTLRCTVCDERFEEDHTYDSHCDERCNGCSYVRIAPHNFANVLSSNEKNHWYGCLDCDAKKDLHAHVYEDLADGECDVCAYVRFIRGDMDADGDVDSDDAIYLLYYVLFGEQEYPLVQPADVDGNAKATVNDSIYLLNHVIFGATEYPLLYIPSGLADPNQGFMGDPDNLNLI